MAIPNDSYLVSRGRPERVIIQNNVVKQMKNRIVDFFRDYRDRIKTIESSREQLFNTFKNEFLESLDKEETLCVYKELQELYNGPCPNGDRMYHQLTENNQISPNNGGQQPSSFIGYMPIDMDNCNNSSNYNDNSSSSVASHVDYNTQVSDGNSSVQDIYGNVTYQYDIPSTQINGIYMNNQSLDVNGTMCVNRSNSEVNEMFNDYPNGFPDSQVDFFYNKENENNIVEDVFNKLSAVIKVKGNVVNELSMARKQYGNNIYKYVMTFIPKRPSSNILKLNQEPLLFQLATKIDEYELILQNIQKNGLLNLDLRDYGKISIFQFLLTFEIESLYKFLKYIKRNNLHSQVFQICSTDILFQTTITKMKNSRTTTERKTLLSTIQHFCLSQVSN